MATQDEQRNATDPFPTAIDGLPEATRPEVVELVDGDTYELDIGAVRKQIEGSTVRMLAYSGSIPGPTLRVTEGAKVSIRATNRADHETTVHWHGLRLDNRYDGTHETQAPIPVGETFSYELAFPDPGVYWYHPHGDPAEPPCWMTEYIERNGLDRADPFCRWLIAIDEGLDRLERKVLVELPDGRWPSHPVTEASLEKSRQRERRSSSS